MIQVDHLVKNYGSHQAVKNISFHVEKGQVVGLLGPNGAGKSTTMNILTGYLSATDGDVKIGDYDILDEPLKAKKLIGYLPEVPPLYTDMTVSEYLNFVSKLKKVGKEERKKEVKRVMGATGILDVAERLIKNLSKGYRQRVGLAQALIGNPPLLILDEPTVGLDPNQIIEIRELIKKLGKDHTIILSSHILSEVSAVCDSIIIIDNGKIVAEDTTENLTRDFSDQGLIKLTVKGKKEDVEKVLNSCDFIQNFALTQKDGMTLVEAKSKVKEDMRDEIFFAFANEKLPVVHMEQETLSLEEIFLKLTREEEK
ncbi:MAG: ABC transporter ATP-binding protein [Lachnospiraceae bacterium]|nr:ABC transporter ATP-binding protein [Lachnospiraceae bacterium]